MRRRARTTSEGPIVHDVSARLRTEARAREHARRLFHVIELFNYGRCDRLRAGGSDLLPLHQEKKEVDRTIFSARSQSICHRHMDLKRGEWAVQEICSSDSGYPLVRRAFVMFSKIACCLM